MVAKKSLSYLDDDGNEFEIDFPATWEICDECRGAETIVNPSIDGNGITGSEMHELTQDDPDFAENYKNGFYDVACKECCGSGKVLCIDYEAVEHNGSEQQKAALEQHYECLQMDAAERAYQRLESGY